MFLLFCVTNLFSMLLWLYGFLFLRHVSFFFMLKTCLVEKQYIICVIFWPRGLLYVFFVLFYFFSIIQMFSFFKFRLFACYLLYACLIFLFFWLISLFCVLLFFFLLWFSINIFLLLFFFFLVLSIFKLPTEN